MTRRLPDRPDFDHLKNQAKQLLRGLAARDPQAERCNNNAVRLMLSAGWPLDGRSQSGGTALHWASWHGTREMVREILRYHPPVDVRGDDYDLPPLGWAFHGSENSWHRETGDHVGVVEALPAAGAKVPRSPPRSR